MKRYFSHGASILLLVLTALPFTAPFSTYKIGDHGYDLRTAQVEMLSAKTSADEEIVILTGPPVGPAAGPVFAPLSPGVIADESSKHLIPSRILRL